MVKQELNYLKKQKDIHLNGCLGFIENGTNRDGSGKVIPNNYAQILMDAALTTSANITVPVQLLSYWDPKAITVLTSKRSATEIFPEVKKGDFASQQIYFRQLEHTGGTKPYSDFSDSGMASVNYNFPHRDVYRFQSHIIVGDLEAEMSGEAKINLVADKQRAAANAIAIDANKFYLYGVGGVPVMETVNKDGTKTPVDFKKIVANVAKPQIANCASCHFLGGGGDAVKHGDLDTSLLTASRSLDVHMSKDGADFTCQRCHTTENHQIAGRSYSTPAFEERTTLNEDDMASRITCESCHTAAPHKAGHKANDHTDKVSCQACHIPAFAREKATEMAWDWSAAGKLKDGKPYSVKNEFGTYDYSSLKGSFDWQKNVTPVYHWYSGSMDYLLLTDKVEDISKPVEITKIIGDASDPNARIMPFKEHKGKQPFDPVNKTFVAPHLFGNDDTSYWKNFDRNKAIAAGQKSLGLPYSGEYIFVDTVYYYPTTHMVAPKENSVSCVSCHNRDSLLKDIDGVWIPGRDYAGWVDMLGWILVFGSLAGVLVHAALRVITRKNRKQRG